MDRLESPAVAALRQRYLHGIDARFLELTDTANAAFRAGDNGAADRLYADALAEAERLLREAAAGGSPLLAPMAVTIAHQNAAEVKKQAGDERVAHGLERRAVELLIETAASPSSPIALRINCLRHLRHALAGLSREAADEALTARCRTVANAVLRIARELDRDRRAPDKRPASSALN